MNDESILEQLKDEHLDLMIRLAFELEIAQTVEKMEAESGSLTEDDEAIARRALDIAYEKLRQQALSERKSRRASVHRRRLMRAIEIISCAVLIVAISAPMALANFEFLRQRLVEFLVSFDTEEETVEVTPIDEIAIPEEWTGKYFPTNLPPETQVDWVSTIGIPSIRFITEGDVMITFTESNIDSSIMAGAKDNVSSTTAINGYPAQVTEFFEDGDYIRFVWENDECRFSLETKNLDYEPTHIIAESVMKIPK